MWAIKILYLLLFLSVNLLSSQSLFLGHNLNIITNEKVQNTFDEEAYRKTIFNKYSEIIKDQVALNEFASFLVETKKHYVNSNIEYLNEEATTSYLKKICSKFNLDNKEVVLNVKIIRDASVNACAFEDGTIYINVGLIAKYQNEAELAAVLGHEIGHVVKRHSYKHYLAYKKFYHEKFVNENFYGNPWLGGGTSGTKVASKELIRLEEESDDVSIELMNKSEFNNRAICSIQSQFIDIKDKYYASHSVKKNRNYVYLNTHPPNKNRLKKAEKNLPNYGRNFLVDSTYFFTLKQKAIDETINILFEEQNYTDCIEYAFVQHMKYPVDPFYLFFLTESTRRLISYDPYIGDISFISGYYNLDFAPNSKLKENTILKTAEIEKSVKKSDLNSILLKLNSPILCDKPSDFIEFKNKQLLNEDTIEFFTYLDALNYFKTTNIKNNFLLNNLFLSDQAINTSKLSSSEMSFFNMKKAATTELKEGRNLFILFSANRYDSEVSGSLFNVHDEFSINHEIFYQVTKRLQSSDSSEKKLYFGHDIESKDRRTLNNYLSLLFPLIKNKEEKIATMSTMAKLMGGASPDIMNTRDSAWINTKLVSPEVNAILLKYNIKNIIYSSVDISYISGTNMLSGQSGSTEKWKINLFYLRNNENKLSFLLTPNCVAYKREGKYIANTYDPNRCYYETLQKLIGGK
jgi:hypothetical protein